MSCKKVRRGIKNIHMNLYIKEIQKTIQGLMTLIVCWGNWKLGGLRQGWEGNFHCPPFQVF